MIQTINISLIPSENKPVINVSQFDNISRVLRFNVFDDAEMEVPHVFDNTETVLLNIRKNDNNIVVITGVIVSDIDPDTQETLDQYLTFELTEQACACVGSNYGEVSITSGDEVIGSCNFRLLVERSPLAGGVSSQTAIDNLTTQIEQITEEVIGDNYYDKQAIDGMIDDIESEIPTKTSQLTNDSGFITASDIPAIPTKTSQLTNDSGFITASDIPEIPTKTSQLTNDSGFTTIDDTATANDKTWSSEKISDELYDLLPVGSASGEVASFNTALTKPLVSCVVDENATKLAHSSGDSDIAPFFKGLLDGTFRFLDLSLGNWGNTTYTNVFARSVDDIVLPPNWNTKGIFIANRYTVGIANNLSGSGHDKEIALTPNGYLWIKDTDYNTPEALKASLTGVYAILERTVEGSPSSESDMETLADAYNIDIEFYDLPLNSMPITYIGDNNFFTDNGDVSLTYKDTIQNYIDTRVNAVSNRSLSIQRTLETLEKSVTLDKSLELERGDNNDDNAR